MTSAPAVPPMTAPLPADPPARSPAHAASTGARHTRQGSPSPTADQAGTGQRSTGVGRPQRRRSKSCAEIQWLHAHRTTQDARWRRSQVHLLETDSVEQHEAAEGYRVHGSRPSLEGRDQGPWLVFPHRSGAGSGQRTPERHARPPLWITDSLMQQRLQQSRVDQVPRLLDQLPIVSQAFAGHSFPRDEAAVNGPDVGRLGPRSDIELLGLCTPMRGRQG